MTPEIILHSFSVTSANIANNISPKTRFFELHFSFKHYITFNHFDVWAPKATEFGEITQNNDRYAVQGHSRSPILVYQSHVTLSD